MIGKLRSLVSKMQNLAPRPAPAAKRPPMQVADGFGAGSRQAAVRASGPKVLQGMSAGSGRSLGEALVASSLTPEERTAYQSVMEELSGSPHAQEYVKRAFQDGKLAKLMGGDQGGEPFERIEMLAEEGRRYAQLPAEARASFDAQLEVAADDPHAQQRLRQNLFGGPSMGLLPKIVFTPSGSNEGTQSTDPLNPILSMELIEEQAAMYESARMAGVGHDLGSAIAAQRPGEDGLDNASGWVDARRGKYGDAPIDPNATGGGNPAGTLGDPVGRKFR